MKSSCIFCSIATDMIVDDNELAFAIRDKFPVSRLHTLILPKRCVDNYFDLSQNEVLSIHDLAKKIRRGIQSEDPSVEGFNFGEYRLRGGAKNRSCSRPLDSSPARTTPSPARATMSCPGSAGFIGI